MWLSDFLCIKIKLSLKKFIYLIGRERMSKSSCLLVYAPSAPNSPAGQAETWSWERRRGLPCGWRQPSLLRHCCCLPGSPLAGSWTRQSWGWNWGRRLLHQARCLPQNSPRSSICHSLLQRPRVCFCVRPCRPRVIQPLESPIARSRGRVLTRKASASSSSARRASPL